MQGGLPYASVSSPAAWRVLLARGALLRACAPRIALLHDLSFAYDSVDGAVKDLAKAAGAARATASDSAAVTAASNQWRIAIDDWLNNPGTATSEERTLLDEVARLCASATPADPFKAIFHAICDLSAEIYGDRWPAPTLMLDDLPAHPRTPPDYYAVTAKTTPAQPPVVRLLIHPRGLGPATFAALPGLLAHECICHVPARQDRVKNDSSFAEGLMDWAATYFFERSMARLLPDLNAAASAHASPFGALFASPQTKPGRARLFGRLAANNLVSLTISELGVSPPQAKAIVARVARDLNCVAASIDEKDRRVADIAGLSELPALLSAVLKGDRPAADLL